MVAGGYGCTSGTAALFSGTYTIIDLGNTIDSNGSLKSWCVRTYVTQSTSKVKLKIFRANGSNYDVVWAGDWERVTADGTHTFSLNSPVPVLTGDIVGVTVFDTAPNDTKVELTASGTNLIKWIVSDVVALTAVASWTDLINASNLRVNVSSNIISVQYVKTAGDNTYSGSDWNNAKKDIKDGLRFIGTSGTCHIGFGDYSAQSGIKFDRSVSLLCETADTGGGTGTVNLPKAAWSQCDFTNTALDRSNTNTSTFNSSVGCNPQLMLSYIDKLAIFQATAQRFVPASRCLKSVVLKLKRLVDTNLYVEIREESGGYPQGTPQDATGQVGYVTVNYSDVSALALTEVTITFNLDMGNTNPKWIVISLVTYDPNYNDNTANYQIAGGDGTGTDNEFVAWKVGNCGYQDTNSVGASNLYFKTYRGI